MTRVKALLRRWFAAVVDDEYQRVTKDNVVLRGENMAIRAELARYQTALAGATVDLREETAARIRAQATAAALEEEVNAAWGVRNRTIRQRDLVIAERDAMRDRLVELGEVMVEVPEHG
jgi:cell division septum initiation protein DivIVA